VSFLLDTNICSHYLRTPGPLFHRFQQHLGRLHLSVISLGELYCWTLDRSTSPRHHASLGAFLNDVTVLDTDIGVARKFGEVRSALIEQGKAAPSIDMLIAATALVHQLTLVTHNTADFANVAGLQVVDWLAP
jgi:predicted nucleic acid-binding protein